MRGRALGLAPWLILLTLCTITLLVWRQQVQNELDLRRRHTRDVCEQASRRLEVFLESRLTILRIFAQRWASHEGRDYSRRRFEEFASLIVEEVPGYAGIGLVAADQHQVWLVPGNHRALLAELGPTHHDLMKQASAGRAVLSAPITTTAGRRSLLTVQPLHRDRQLLGYWIVELDIGRLMENLFHERIRSEFNFRIEQDGQLLYAFTPDDSPTAFANPDRTSSQSFDIAEHRWTLTTAPRRYHPGWGAWRTDLAVPILGLVLSLAISGLVYTLGRRVHSHRIAKEQVLVELVARQQAEGALREAEARYHSVFDAASDGLLVLDQSGRIVEANHAAGKLYGCDPSKLEGRTLQELFGPAHRPNLTLLLNKLSRYSDARIDATVVTASGTTIDVEARGTSFRYQDKQRLLAVVSDVTERKRAQERHALLSRKALLAQEDERARVSRDLHDELGQLLTAARFELGMLQRTPANQTSLATAIDIVEKAAVELRRICKGLRPPLLDDLGIGPAIEFLLNEFEERSKIACNLEITLSDQGKTLPKDTALAVYRIIQEALNNVSRHAEAQRVSVSLVEEMSEVRLSVYDDGKGFEMSRLNASEGSGIVGMQERAQIVGGHLRVRSLPDEGCRVELTVPVPTRTAEESS